MGFTYNKLWKMMIDKKINKTTLKSTIGITTSTLAKLSKDQNVSMDVLGKICKKFDCDIGDIVEYKKDEDGILGGESVESSEGIG